MGLQVAKSTPINEKMLLIGLQAHGFAGGIIEKFTADRGGQWLLYQPRMEGDGKLPVETNGGETFKYPCNPFSADQCYIHPDYKRQLDCACGSCPSTTMQQQ